VANDVTQQGAGFDTDTNIVTMYLPDAPELSLPKMNKFDVANRIFDQALSIRKNSK
jgi:phosphopantothenoylcysteine decarboxylase/phosphopantothenate--cysteine ligase